MEWANPDAAADVTVEYSTDRGGSWKPAASAQRDHASNQIWWTVPDQSLGPCALRLISGHKVIAETSIEIIPSQAREYEWRQVSAKADFSPRDGAGAIVFDGRMWLIGGWRPKNGGGGFPPFPRVCTNEVWRSVNGKDWELCKPNTFLDASFDSAADWEGRHTAGYVVHNNRMWIVGGDPIQGHYQSDVWSSGDGVKWKNETAGKPVPWGPRALHTTIAFKDWIWVIGGQTTPQFAAADEKFYRDVWRSKDGVEWEQVKPREPFWPQRGMIGGTAVLHGRLWLLGGGTYDTPQTPTRKFFNDVWSTADGITWQQHVDHAPWAARQYHDVAVFDDRLWVLEGFSGANRNDVWYSSDGVNWYELPNTPWKPRHAASVFVHDGSLWMVTGNNLESDVWRLCASAPRK
jgi:hypothetical protein